MDSGALEWVTAEMCNLQGLMESNRTALQGKVFFEDLHHIREGEKKDMFFLHIS